MTLSHGSTLTCSTLGVNATVPCWLVHAFHELDIDADLAPKAPHLRVVG